jgi:hypothetical protein
MPAAKVFPKSNWDRFAQQLDALPERPASDRGLAVRDAIKDIRNSIRAAQAKGYTLEQIIEQAKSADIDISAGTLKRAMRTSGKRAAASDQTGGTTRSIPKPPASNVKPVRNKSSSYRSPMHEPTPTPTSASMSTATPAPTRGTFKVNPDTDDL